MTHIDTIRSEVYIGGMANTCLDCRWFEPHDTEVSEGWGIGVCKRFPPALDRIHHKEIERWPVIIEPDHCGEWRQKPLTPP